MNSINSSMRKNGREHGEVFTNRNVIKYILDEVSYCEDTDLSKIRILEPSSGKGAFAIEIISRLFQSSCYFNFSFVEALRNNVTFVEYNESSYEELVKLIELVVFRLTGETEFSAHEICIQSDYLLLDFPNRFDCIVGNPPYIRHELIPEEKKRLYRRIFKTFRHRADIYIPFFEHSLRLLNPKGKLCFICSNRWLNNQYGECLRELIATRYNLDKLVNIEKSSPFDEDVVAYPCITTISNNPHLKFTLIAEDHSKEINFDSIVYKEIDSPNNGAWQNLFLSYDINHKALLGIKEQGFEIGIGVATGADNVFIKNENELNGIERSRVIPLVKSIDLKNNQLEWQGHFVINPYENNKLCDLSKYPHLNKYLTEHKATLLNRHTAKKNPDKWYKTIDAIKPELQHRPKLLLPDLSSYKTLFIDEGNFYPHHNLYYVTNNQVRSLKILAGILLSEFIRNQMSQIGIRMNGGLPRFQSQVLRKLKIPNISLFHSNEANDLIVAYESQNLSTINTIINNYCAKHGISISC